MSFPRANDKKLFEFENSSLDIISLKRTIFFVLFGTSIPTAALFGIGASIRTPPAAKFKDMSSAKLVILLILTPADGCNSYRVTDGPLHMSTIRVSTPKLFKVSTSKSAFALNSAEISTLSFNLGLVNKFIDGKTYPFELENSPNLSNFFESFSFTHDEALLTRSSS